MPTSTSNRNNSTKVSDALQEDLAEYGLLRSRAMGKAPPKANGDASFFGMKNDGKEKPELKFTGDVKAIQNSDMMVSMVAPDNKPFDMLVTTNFNKAISEANEDDLRSFLRRIVAKA